MMKKIVSIVAAACLTVSLAGTIFAGEEGNVKEPYIVPAEEASTEVLEFAPEQLMEIKANPNFSFHSKIQAGGGPGASGGGQSGETQAEEPENLSSPILDDYYMSQYLVTNGMYKTFIDDTGREAPSYWTDGNYPEGKANHPVLYVSYLDAAAYCEWLAQKYPEWNFRLPTEAEWENACYASALEGHGDYTYPWGTDAGLHYDAETGELQNNYLLSCNAVVAAMVLDPEGEYGPDYTVTYVKEALEGSTVTLGELLTISENGEPVQTWANHGTGEGFIFTDLYREISADGGLTFPVDIGYVNEYGLYGCAGNAWCWTDTWIIAQNGAEAGQEVRSVRGGSWYATTRSCSANTRGEGRAEEGAFNTIGFRLAATPAE